MDFVDLFSGPNSPANLAMAAVFVPITGDHSDHSMARARAMAAPQVPTGKAMAADFEVIRVLQKGKDSQPVAAQLCQLPPFQRLRQRILWWKRHAPSHISQLILQGVQHSWDLSPVLSCQYQKKSPQDLQKVSHILAQYQAAGAIKPVSAQGTKHLIPWFVISKQENDHIKDRLITDCREINQWFPTTNFRLDHIHNILPFLRKGLWAAKVD